MENLIFIICHLVMIACSLLIIYAGAGFKLNNKKVTREKLAIKTAKHQTPVPKIGIGEIKTGLELTIS